MAPRIGGDAIRLDHDHAARSLSPRGPLSQQDVRPVRRCEDVSSFAVDVLACPHCGDRLRLIATLHDPVVILKLLPHLGMARSGPSPGLAPPAPRAGAP